MDDKLIKEGLEAIRNNRIAKSLLVDFVFRHKRGIQQDQRVMNYLHDAFCKILCGVPVDKALHLKKDSKPGPKENKLEKHFKDLSIYKAVLKLKMEERKLEKVYDELAQNGVLVHGGFNGKQNKMYFSRTEIRRSYYKIKKKLNEHEPWILELL